VIRKEHGSRNSKFPSIERCTSRMHTIPAPVQLIWRRMLRVSWTEKRTNESILMEIGHARRDMSLRQRAAKQKLTFFGHTMRANCMERI